MRSIPLHRPFSLLRRSSLSRASPPDWPHEPPHTPNSPAVAPHTASPVIRSQTSSSTSLCTPALPTALKSIVYLTLENQVGADLSRALPIHWPCEPPHAPNSPVVASHFPSVFVTLHDRACHAASIQHLPIPILSYIAIEPDPSTHSHRIQAEKSKPFSKKEQCNS